MAHSVLDAPKTTYSDTTPQERVISDVINIIDPRDTPLIAALGGLDAARSKFKVRQNGTKIEILEDELAPLSGAVSHTEAIATDSTTIPVADASVFKVGHVIKAGDELMVVSASSATGNTLVVYSRSYGGTNSTHATNAAISIVGMARLEGADATYDPIIDIEAPYNYTAIFEAALNITGTQQVIDQYGIGNEYEYQAMKKIPEKLRELELSLFHGIRAAGSASAPRSMGGLGTFVTGNSVNAGGGIAQSDIDNVMEYCYADGGNPDLLVVNHAVARDLKTLVDTSSFVRLGYENDQVGMSPVKRVVTQYGQLQILMDRFCPVGSAYVIDSRKAGLYTLRPFAWKELAMTGDSKKGELVGEFSFLLANDEAHGFIYGITS